MTVSKSQATSSLRVLKPTHTLRGRPRKTMYLNTWKKSEATTKAYQGQVGCTWHSHDTCHTQAKMNPQGLRGPTETNHFRRWLGMGKIQIQEAKPSQQLKWSCTLYRLGNWTHANKHTQNKMDYISSGRINIFVVRRKPWHMSLSGYPFLASPKSHYCSGQSGLTTTSVFGHERKQMPTRNRAVLRHCCWACDITISCSSRQVILWRLLK